MSELRRKLVIVGDGACGKVRSLLIPYRVFLPSHPRFSFIAFAFLFFHSAMFSLNSRPFCRFGPGRFPCERSGCLADLPDPHFLAVMRKTVVDGRLPV